MSFNTYGKKTTTYSGNTAIWLGTGEVFPGGGVLAADYVVADALYPAGSPVYLDIMGGTLTPCEVFELVDAIGSGDTNIKVKLGNQGTVPAVSVPYGVAPATGYVIAKAAVASVVAIDASGFYDLSIVANSLGTASEGDFLVICTSVGSNQSMLAPANGLLYNDIHLESGDTSATGAMRVSGQVLEDRIPSIPPNVKASLNKITFIKEE